MEIRLPHSSVYRNALRNLSRTYDHLFEVQRQIATGKRLHAPSDEPASVPALLGLRQARSDLERVATNAGFLDSEYSFADHALQELSRVASRGLEIGVQAANASVGSEDRLSIALEVDSLLAEAIALANTRTAAGYVFTGSDRSQLPFATVETGSGPRVRYVGGDRGSSVDLGRTLQLGATFPGSGWALRDDRQTTLYPGLTGAAPGSGTDGVRGFGTLLVAHTQTLLGGAATDPLSGLTPGASSAGGDTLLGNHTVTLVDTSGTGAGGTVSIAGGPPVAWTSADTDLAVSAPGGAVLYLDLSGITAGFNGTVAADSAGTLSLDGGLTTTPIDFASQNQLVLDSRTGESIFVDSTGIHRAAEERLRFPGTYDLFSALKELSDQLRNVEQLDRATQDQRIQDALAELHGAHDAVLGGLGDVGSRQRIVDLTRGQTATLGVLLQERQADLEDVDLSQAAVDLTITETALQASLSVSARIAQLPSLVNLL